MTQVKRGSLGPRSTSAMISQAAPPFALLPVGSCEQHGPHLPVGTDATTAGWVGQRVCDQIGGLLLPVLAYGTSAEHRGFAGTISLRPQTLAAIIDDVAASCVACGIRRLAIVSGHGGNWILRPAVRDINVQRQDCTVLLVPEAVMWADEFANDLHAGRTETSMMLHLDPEAVGTPPPDFVPDTPREALDVLSMRQLTPDGVWGRPSQASAEYGETFLAGMAQRVADYLRDTFTTLATRREETLT